MGNGGLKTTKEQFVKDLYPYAVYAGEKRGVNPLYILSQWAYESGYGGATKWSSWAKNYNYAGANVYAGAKTPPQWGANKKGTNLFTSPQEFTDYWLKYILGAKGSSSYFNQSGGTGIDKAQNVQQYAQAMLKGGYVGKGDPVGQRNYVSGLTSAYNDIVGNYSKYINEYNTAKGITSISDIADPSGLLGGSDNLLKKYPSYDYSEDNKGNSTGGAEDTTLWGKIKAFFSFVLVIVVILWITTITFKK